ncbi:HAMP domain-containing sensor histidine kinase [Uliginosibacterium paludis]|uniref:histidine kinase n=1 Tax=Uliginosibacterium paludis TaxID=1615952 RepID=A0ABV2CVR5_9RHOO
MGRLFWKLFLAIFLTQLVTAWGVGVLFWISRPVSNPTFEDREGPRPFFPAPPPRDFQSDRPPPGEFRGPQPPFASAPGPRPDGSRPNNDEFRPNFFPGPRHRSFPWQPVTVGFIVSLLFAAGLARHLSRPIVGLRKAFGELASGRFEHQASRGRRVWPDELSDLAIDFDRTAGQVKMLIQNQRRLLHDVSHEVRSPLARMQLAIDLARQQPDKTGETMARLERESARINRLVEELLTLSRLEAGACGALNEEIDLPGMLAEIVEDARFEASARDCKVALQSIDHMSIQGHPALLQRAIENVIRNAIRHTPEHSTVSVSLASDTQYIRLTVEDCGPGVPEDALERIFEPFVRLHQPASHEGYGLGLAITRQTLETHGGQVSATNRPQGGLCMTLTLPRPSAS